MLSNVVVDVSEHNGVIDWEKVKASGAHAILRCGYGQDIKSQDDKQWARNLSECERLGIPHGAYLYSYASSADAAEGEAAHMLRLCEGHEFQYPLYLDVEECKYRLVAPEVCLRWGEVMETAGFYVGIYANLDWWTNYLFGLERFDKWIAKWSSTEPPIACGLWQYSNKGHVSGVPDTSEGGVDVNRAFTDYPSLLGEFYGKQVAADMMKLDDLALAVVNGRYGNGAERRALLGSRYEQVQERVNFYYTDKGIEYLAGLVIAGEFGNGNDRKAALGPLYEKVQKVVNKLAK